MKRPMKPKNNPMKTENVPVIIAKMGWPIIASMIFQAMYNMVDSIFVARMPDSVNIINAGEKGVTALTLAFPVQLLIIAFGVGTGVGVGAMVSRLLGMNRSEKAAKAAGNGIFLAILIYFTFCIFGVIGISTYLKTQIQDYQTYMMAEQYMKICIFWSFGLVLYDIYEKVLQSTGKTILSGIAQTAGAVTNLILDPILIYGLLGMPALGIRGAAIATVAGQILSLVTAFILQEKVNTEIRIKPHHLKPNFEIIRSIYSIGISAIVMGALNSFLTYGLNLIFGLVSVSAVTAFGVFYKIEQFVFMAGYGLRDTITPFIAYNYGAALKKRVKSGIHWGVTYMTAVMVIGNVILFIYAHPLAKIFGLSAQTEELCVLAMRVISISFVMAGISMALQGVFQGMEAGNSSLLVSVLRLLIIPLPVAYLFTTFVNPEKYIFFSLVIGEFVAVIVAVLLYIRLKNELKC